YGSAKRCRASSAPILRAILNRKSANSHKCYAMFAGATMKRDGDWSSGTGKRIVCVGEGMLELSRRSEHWDMHYGGDTLNTAIHLARAGHDVAYMTALGSDPLSRQMAASWAGEGIDTSLICEHPTRQAGL